MPGIAGRKKASFPPGASKVQGPGWLLGASLQYRDQYLAGLRGHIKALTVSREPRAGRLLPSV